MGGLPQGISAETSPVLNSPEACAVKKVDVGRVRFVNLCGEEETRLFINIADLGAGGLVVQKAIRAPRILGRRPNYAWGILTAALFYRAREVTISVDGGPPVRLAAGAKCR